MPNTEAQYYPQAATALKECLEAIPRAIVTIKQDVLLGSSLRPDFVAEVTVAGRHTALIAELKKTGEPQVARSAINQINTYRRSLISTKAGGIFSAPYISEAAAKLCRDEEIGYLDLAGNCHIAFNGVYIHIEGKPNPAAQSRSLRSLYQPKAERILRVLLANRVQPWRIQALATEAEVSVGQSFKVKKLLLEKEWIKETALGISLTRPRDLLTTWAESYRFAKHQAAQFYTLSDLADFEQTLSLGCRQREIPCAFTSFAAAARYAPYATSRRTTAYIHRELAEVQNMLSSQTLQLDPVETGANVILLTPYDDGVFYGTRHHKDINLASPVQTYLDLRSTGSRGQEAAEVLFQKEIAPNW
jgi:hypothetical protein